jgi:protein-S-isoprenylcysteine O-methyltransferase Ste14
MLIRELERQGDWLFRYRSYVPLALLPLGLIALSYHAEYLGGSPIIELLYEIGCLLISISGLVVRGIALGHALPRTSGRNTAEQIADSLNTQGIYSVVRHPLYLGNMLMVLGVLLFTKSFFLALAGMLFYLLFYERIIAREEQFLNGKFGDVFRDWAERTPLLWPHFSLWQEPGYPFNARAAIKGEFYGFTATVTAMMLMDALKNWFVVNRLIPHLFWIVLFAISLVAFFILRHLRKHTRFFETGQDAEPAKR